MADVDSNIHHRHVTFKNFCTELVRWPLGVQMQNLFPKIHCVSWTKLFFSCYLVYISMTRAFRCQYASENKAVYRRPTPGVDIPFRRYTGFRRHREVCVKPVYRRATLQGRLQKVGLLACDVLRVKEAIVYYVNNGSTVYCTMLVATKALTGSNIVSCFGYLRVVIYYPLGFGYG